MTHGLPDTLTHAGLMPSYTSSHDDWGPDATIAGPDTSALCTQREQQQLTQQGTRRWRTTRSESSKSAAESSRATNHKNIYSHHKRSWRASTATTRGRDDQRKRQGARTLHAMYMLLVGGDVRRLSSSILAPATTKRLLTAVRALVDSDV
jgi:hypothetical protein